MLFGPPGDGSVFVASALMPSTIAGRNFEYASRPLPPPYGLIDVVKKSFHLD
jgi:hypothetical protein